MKKLILTICIQYILWMSAFTVCAEGVEGSSENTPERTGSSAVLTVSDEMIEILSENRDNLFPITSQKESYTEQTKPVFSDAGSETFVCTSTNSGRRNIALFANLDQVHDYNAYSMITNEFPSNFQMTMDVTINDIYPKAEGGCFIGFTNEGVIDYGEDEENILVSALINGAEAQLYVKYAEDEAGTHYSLLQTPRNFMKLTIIHLTGHTYVYVNENYAGQFHDGLAGPFQMVFGASVTPNGDTANCSFDNLVVRKVTNR